MESPYLPFLGPFVDFAIYIYIWPAAFIIIPNCPPATLCTGGAPRYTPYIYIYICGFKAGGAPACRPASCAAFGSWSWSCSWSWFWSWFWSWRFGLMFGGAPGVRRQHFEPRLPEPVPGSGPGPGHCFFVTFWGCARVYAVYIYIYMLFRKLSAWGCARGSAVYIYIYM